MSHEFKRVNWNPRKKVYDLVLWVGIIGFVALFVLITNAKYSGDAAVTPIIVLMRAFAACGFAMLTFILCIGPLARIDSRFLPLLYNRRHFGVSFFIVVLIHAILALFWYHSFGPIHPLDSVITSGGSYESVSNVPFQLFGLLALLIFFVMAATSHDYWNAVLGTMWKGIHVLIYPAYFLIVLHVGFGAMQQDHTGFLPVVLLGSIVLVGGLHLYSALFCSREDQALDNPDSGEWVDAGKWQDIENNRAITVQIGKDERVAIFRFDDTSLSAVSNVCQHQNGPLGEGKVIDGCITCPWHGYQYRPEDGCSPPPFTEKIETYRLKLEGDRILLDPKALPKGTARAVTTIV